MWKYTARDPCTGWVRTIGCSIGLPYLSRSSGRVSVVSPSRPLNVVSDSRRRRSSSGRATIGRAHARHAGAAAGRRNLDPVQDGGGRRALAVGVVGVPLLGRLLAVPVPDQPDQGEVRHVVLRVVLLHRRPEHRRGGEILGGRQGLVVEHQRQMIGQRARQRLPGRLVDRRLRSTPATSAPSEGWSGVIRTGAMARRLSGPGRGVPAGTA